MHLWAISVCLLLRRLIGAREVRMNLREPELRPKPCGLKVFQRLAIVLFLAGLTRAGSMSAAEPAPQAEYQLKAIFLLNFVQFVEWPESTFATATAPLIVTVSGDDPFGPALDSAVRGEKMRGHPLEIRRLKAEDELTLGHIVFIARSERDRIPEFLQKLLKRPVLTVSETPGFAEQGGAINFFMTDRRVRFEINPEAITEQGLKISSKLLQLGKVVGSISSK